jgi:hypothetical protein
MVMAYFTDHRTMQREFSCKNTCGACYISTRANAEKTPRELLEDNLAVLGRALRWDWLARRLSSTPERSAATA